MSTKKFASASRVIGTVLVVAVAMGSATGIASAETQSVTASAAGIVSAEDLKLVASSVGEDVTAVESALRVIDSIPEDVLRQGDQATIAWLESNYKTSPGAAPYAFNLAQCSYGILIAIGSNAVAAAKIIKIKRIVDKFGGVGKVIDKLQAKKKQGKKFKTALVEVFEEGGIGVGALAAEILGVDKVIQNCW
ncbi:hypothetical protein [Pseudonocardia sp. ICBG601]|uniref:hypothetical protein n=1 Tax=Pseudonocardia sp. ICBG601 TaxID=2846759 RepID=UPI001CF6499C|nr:hypothetical protein [Pseudonocardia sp. ICBG601]